jgi:hypothetical protein
MRSAVVGYKNTSMLFYLNYGSDFLLAYYWDPHGLEGYMITGWIHYFR